MSDKMEKTFKKRTDKLIEGRKYAVISPQSIVTLAESCGILELSEEMASKIGEDVTYRLREIIQGCSVHMRNSNENILRSTHVARVLPNCSEMKVYGYLSGGTSEFLYVPDADVFVSEYNELIVNLSQIALEKETFVQKGEQFVQGMWLEPDPVQCAPLEIEPSTSTATSDAESSSVSAVPPHLVDYYSTFAKIILCKHGEVLNTVLQDLRSNSKIILVVPYFLNLFIDGLQELPRGSDACEHLIWMLHSLTLNPFIYRDAAVVINRLLTSLLMYCVDPMPFELVSVSRDVELRGLAAEAVTKVIVHWYGCDDAMLDNILQKMQVILLDQNSSVRSHLGALSVLCSLGGDALNCCFWPHIEKYLDFLNKLPVNNETMELEGCLLKIAGYLYPQVFESIEESSEERNTLVWKVAISDRILYSYFGDRLCVRWLYPLRGTSVIDCHFGGSTGESSSIDLKTESEEFSLSQKEYPGRNYPLWRKSLWNKPVIFQPAGVSQHPTLSNVSPESSQLSERKENTETETVVSKPDENTTSTSKDGLDTKTNSAEDTIVEEKRKALERKMDNWKPGDVRNSGGSLTELFELSLVKHGVLRISSIRDFPTWTHRLKRRKTNDFHQIFSYSSYHKKSLQLNQIGKFTNIHVSTWSRNFTDVLSTCL